MPAVAICALPVFEKGPAGFFFIAVNIPIPDEFVILRVVLDKARDVLWRIAEKKSNLMRKLFAALHPLHQTLHAFFAAEPGIAGIPENFLCLQTAKFLFETGRPVYIQERFPVAIPERQDD